MYFSLRSGRIEHYCGYQETGPKDGILSRGLRQKHEKRSNCAKGKLWFCLIYLLHTLTH